MLRSAQSACSFLQPLLLAFGLLFVQAADQQHLHLDEGQTTTCQVCAQADTTPGLAPDIQLLATTGHFAWVTTTHAAPQLPATRNAHLPRAPPLA